MGVIKTSGLQKNNARFLKILGLFLKTSRVSQTSGNIAHFWYSVIAKLFVKLDIDQGAFCNRTNWNPEITLCWFFGGFLLFYNSCQPLCSYKLDNFEVANYKLQVDKWRQQEQIRFVSHFIFGTFLFYRNMSAMCYWPAVSYNCPDERTDKVLSRRTFSDRAPKSTWYQRWNGLQ